MHSKNNMAWNDKTKCPVCKKTLLVVGIRNHIIGSAKGELYRWYFDRTQKKAHLEYVQGNTKIEEVKVIKLSL